MIITDKKRIVYCILIAVFAALLTIVIGIVFSLLTGYKAKDQHLAIKLSVWILNTFISYSIVYLIASIFRKLKTIKRKFFDWVTLILTYGFSVVIVIALSGSFEYEYVVTFIAIAGIIGIIGGILKRTTKKEDKPDAQVSITIEQTTTNHIINNFGKSKKNKKKKRGRR